MKKCPWCGKEYPDDAQNCLIDGESRPDTNAGHRLAETCQSDRANESTVPKGPRYVPQGSFLVSDSPQFIDLANIDDAFEWVEGYSRPNWKLIRDTIRRTVSSENAAGAWAAAAVEWAQQLRDDLGGDYAVRWSQEFILLSSLKPNKADEVLAFAERTLRQLYEMLNESAWKWVYGKHLILLFDDQEDYYQYVSYFYREGVHPASGGCLIHKDYVHIAMPYNDGRHIQTTLAHELMHNSVVHLPLPLWLNEALAVTFDRRVGNYRTRILDGDLRERHFAFWNAQSIQRFWAGASFREPGDSNELSYSLAEIVLNLLMENSAHLGAFVQTARREDAGQDAALSILGKDLGDVAGTFLGEGNWRPNRKAIADCHKKKNENDKAEIKMIPQDCFAPRANLTRAIVRIV